MTEKGNIKSLIIVSTKDKTFIEKPLLREDTPDKVDYTIKELYTELALNGKTLDDYDYYFKPYSNISENEMSNEEYGMIYTRCTGEPIALINKSKSQIENRVKTLNMSLQTKAYREAGLYRMADAISSIELQEIYSDAIVEAKRELFNKSNNTYV